MTEMDIFGMFMALVPPAAALRGVTVQARQSFQPMQSGTPSGPAVAFSTVSSVRYGWRKSAAAWEASSQTMQNHEAQAMETAVQCSLVWVPSLADTLTAFDVAQLVADACQSDRFILDAYEGYEVQILRVSDVRPGRFIGDDSQHANWPSFDIVFKHTREFTSTVAPVTEWDGVYLRPVV